MKPIALAVMAKVPGFGPLKTRLCPPLEAGVVTALYRCFLLDKIAQVLSLRQIADPLIAFTPTEGRGVLSAAVPSDLRLVPQQGADLGARLCHLLEMLLEEGYRGACAIDSDTPTLPTAYLEEACDVLRHGEADLVLGPTEDGGYYLVGLTAPRPELFDGIPWSTAAVFPETRRRAGELGLRVHQLPAWFDVDTGEDLSRLKTSEWLPLETERFLRTMAP